MTFSWRDSVTTLAAAGAVLVERAYSLGWDWALVSNVRWAIAAIAVLGGVVLLFNAVSGRLISWFEYALGLLGVGLAVLGLIYATSGYVLLLMFTVVAMWLVSLLNHTVEWFVEQPQ